jgi:regulator of sigma E protease
LLSNVWGWEKIMPDILLVILAVIFVLGVAINIHEFGHYIVAKMLGMRIEAYSFFGLGPRIWGFKIPLGAYVKLYGDEATSSLEGGSSDGEVVPREELYELRPRWQKFLVMLGGPFMNIVLALAIPFSLAMWIGVPALTSPNVGVLKAGGAADLAGMKEGDRVVKFEGVENPSWERIRMDAIVSPEKQLPITVERNGQRIDLTITPTKGDIKGNPIGELDFEPSEIVVISPQIDSPAMQAGMQKGDRVISLNNTPVKGLDNFKSLVQEYKAAPLQIVAIRNGQEQNFVVNPKIDETGRALIGAGISSQSIDREKSGIGQAAMFAVNSNLEVLRLTGKVFGQLFSGQRAVKDAGLAGPVGIVQQIAQVVREDGFWGLVPMLALISLNLGVFNLLPIPMLDGGQIMMLGVEKVYSWFGKTVSMAFKERVQLVGLAMVLLLMVFTLFLDVSKFFK